MLKRGQVTVFLIVGIVLLGLFAGIYYLVSKTTTSQIASQKDTPFSLEIKPRLTIFVENCLDRTATPAIFQLASQGGYIYLEPKTTLYTENDSIAFSWINQENQIDSEKVTQQLSQYVQDNLGLCIQEFKVFAVENLNISFKDPSVETIIDTNKVTLNLEYPLTIKKGKDTLEIKDFKVVIPLRLGLALQSIQDINEKHRYLYGWDPLLFTNYEHFITIFPYREDLTVLSLYDPLPYQGKNLIFLTAISTEEKNQPPEIEFIPDFVLSKNTPFSYQVTVKDPENDLITLSTDNPSITFDEDKVLTFTPQEAGTFNIKISATDLYNNQDSQIFRIVVEKETRK